MPAGSDRPPVPALPHTWRPFGVRMAGTVLGALVGAGAGAAIGNASAKGRCDASGQYWTRDDTVAYRESSRYRASSNTAYSDYSRRCRLAPADTDYNGRVETRYVRVCPDSAGRYRVQG